MIDWNAPDWLDDYALLDRQDAMARTIETMREALREAADCLDEAGWTKPAEKCRKAAATRGEE